MSRARLDELFLLSGSLLSLSRDVFFFESVSTRPITIKPFQLTHITRLCVQVHAHVRRKIERVVTLGSTQSHCARSVISKTGSLAALHDVIISHVDQFPSYLPCILSTFIYRRNFRITFSIKLFTISLKRNSFQMVHLSFILYEIYQTKR